MVTRVLRVLIAIRIDGEAKLYVDDVMGASARKLWLADREKAVEEMKLLGDEAEAVDKRESSEDNEGRKVDCLGWEFNLGEWVVDVAEENRMKALYLFWTTDLEGTVALETVEALASMAQRYSVVYRELSVMMGSCIVCKGGRGGRGEGGRDSSRKVRRW